MSECSRAIHALVFLGRNLECSLNFLFSIAYLRNKAAQGLNKKTIATRLNIPEKQLDAYWPYSDVGEKPIADPEVFPRLYFIKGALALHGLRKELGDEAFFNGFKDIFHNANSQGEFALDQFRSVFEKASGRDLKQVFQNWYNKTGLPN